MDPGRYGLPVLGTLLLAVAVGIMGAVTRLPPATAVAHGAASALPILSLVTLYHVVQPATRPGKNNA
jgi:heme A synthase